MKSFNLRLREMRVSKNLSQQAFGSICGVGITAQGYYEKGLRFPDSNYLVALAASGYDVKYLITGERDGSDLTDQQHELLNLHAEASEEFQQRAIDLYLIEQQQSPAADNLRYRANVLELITGHRTAGELNEEETLLLLQWKQTPDHIKKGVFNLLATNWFDEEPVQTQPRVKAFNGNVQNVADGDIKVKKQTNKTKTFNGKVQNVIEGDAKIKNQTMK